MERKTSITKKNWQEVIRHWGRSAGRYHLLRKMDRKTFNRGRRWRGRHQPRRKMERKTSATEEDGEEESSNQQKD